MGTRAGAAPAPLPGSPPCPSGKTSAGPSPAPCAPPPAPFVASPAGGRTQPQLPPRRPPRSLRVHTRRGWKSPTMPWISPSTSRRCRAPSSGGCSGPDRSSRATSPTRRSLPTQAQ
ncbi:hypothetical protein FVE89_10755 [Methylobacterium sp. 2A]|nr:hypothetical protein [Methylobacterium sp. 2A]